MTDNRVEALPILIFDGDCGFCTTTARWAERRFGLGNVSPWQALDLAALGLTEHQCEQAVQWVGADGAVSGGHRAVAAALRSSGRPYAALGTIIEWPLVSPLMAVAYRTIAKNRHRLPGATEACRIG